MVSIERAMHYKDMWKEPKSSDIQLNTSYRDWTFMTLEVVLGTITLVSKL